LGTDYVGGEPPEGEGGEPIGDDEPIEGEELIEADGVVVVPEGEIVDLDGASSAVEPGGAESASGRGLDDDVEDALADVEDSESEDTDIDSVDVERSAGFDDGASVVTDADLTRADAPDEETSGGGGQ
jgi:hypothetical protein